MGCNACNGVKDARPISKRNKNGRRGLRRSRRAASQLAGCLVPAAAQICTWGQSPYIQPQSAAHLSRKWPAAAHAKQGAALAGAWQERSAMQGAFPRFPLLPSTHPGTATQRACGPSHNPPRHSCTRSTRCPPSRETCSSGLGSHPAVVPARSLAVVGWRQRRPPCCYRVESGSCTDEARDGRTALGSLQRRGKARV